MRVKFKRGKQRKFLQKVLEATNSPSIRELSSRLEISYSSLKNYFNESRSLPKDLFKDLCYISNFEEKFLNVEYLKDNFGQVFGGKKSKRGLLSK